MAKAKQDLSNPQVQGPHVVRLRDDNASTDARPSRLLTIEETAEILNVSVRNVREQIYRRRLSIVKVGRLVRIEQSELEASSTGGAPPRCGVHHSRPGRRRLREATRRHRPQLTS